MYTVKSRVFGKAHDGRTVLVYPAGAVISDEEAAAAGLVGAKPAKGAKSGKAKAKGEGLTITETRAKVDAGDADDDTPPKLPNLDDLKLAELKRVCDDPSVVGLELEAIDPAGANTRAEYRAVIEAAIAAAAKGDGDDQDDDDQGDDAGDAGAED